MAGMSRAIQVVLATVTVGIALGVVGEALGFSGWAYLAGLLVAMMLVSFVDRDGFYGTGPR
jgi:predicted branched-subunit amino acid permease